MEWLPLQSKEEQGRNYSQIRLYPNSIPPEFCDELIETIKSSPDRIPSHVHQASTPDIRQGTVVMMRHDGRYADIRSRLFKLWEPVIYHYGRHDPGFRIMVGGRFLLSHPRIEEIEPGQQFVWHMDARQEVMATRFVTLFTYLNDVEEGGETQFLQQRISVKPQKGATLIFPPYWTHMHRGAPPKSGTKYTVGAYGMVEPKKPSARPPAGDQ